MILNVSFSDNQDVLPREALVMQGPIVHATLDVLPDHALPDKSTPRSGIALIDTGASVTCFDIEAAKEVGLPIVGEEKMASATHAEQQVPVFAGTIIITNVGKLELAEHLVPTFKVKV